MKSTTLERIQELEVKRSNVRSFYQKLITSDIHGETAIVSNKEVSFALLWQVSKGAKDCHYTIDGGLCGILADQPNRRHHFVRNRCSFNAPTT